MRKSVSAERAAKLFSHLDESIDAVLIVNSRMPFLDDNFRYLTDVRGGVFESSFAIAKRNGVTILTSTLEEEIARRSGCKISVVNRAKEVEDRLKRSIGNAKIVGLNMSGISYSAMRSIRKYLKGVKLKDISPRLNEARMIKSEDEIDRIRKACDIASKVAHYIPEVLRVGMTEREMAAEIDYMLKYEGADGIAFDTIAAFGQATALPHYQPGNGRLKKGSIALFDFGAMSQNYRSDLTRTFFTKPLDPLLAKIYRIVAESQTAAIDRIKDGVRARSIDAAARKVISEGGYGDRFIHSTGHGLGISEHDPGILAERSKDSLKENMVFTVEPGIYLPGKGGVRIEDDLLVMKNGRKLLTTADREIVII